MYNICEQKDSVSMVALLGPVLVDIIKTQREQ